MIKTIALITRKEGVTRKEFAQHYEEVHAPLALKHLTTIKRYVRNHVISTLVPSLLEFDCISEFWFESLEDAMRVQEFSQSEAGQVLRDDEARFMDSSKTLSFLVEEKSSDLDKSATVKAVALLKRKATLDRDSFIEHYEGKHAPLIINNSVGIGRYIRNYAVIMGDEPPFDSFTEIWYQDHQSYEQSLHIRVSDAGKVIADDEASFIDTDKIGFYLVNECVSAI